MANFNLINRALEIVNARIENTKLTKLLSNVVKKKILVALKTQNGTGKQVVQMGCTMISFVCYSDI